ncbi:MAG: hypothetical protein EAZ77_15955 [Nostocales cyanobacterium]|nr:MAG: hypothetical protein EAZ77_15955 [Nostocales cyanobacterium]
MKKLISTIYLIISCISLVSCSNSPTSTTTETLTNNTATTAQSQPENAPEPETETKPKTDTQTKTKSAPQTISNNTTKNKKPQIGTVKELVNGDLLCYVTLVDEQGQENRVGASFEICAEERKFLNKKVRVVFTIESVNDCESAEPCGKTRQESIITKMEVLDEKTSTNPKESKTQTISNSEWTITTDNHESWTGVNNTGNIIYKGCDAKGKCLELTGGKISCRDGKCVTGWTNGDYVYILEQPITEDGNTDSTLIVRKGDQEILKATGLK